MWSRSLGQRTIRAIGAGDVSVTCAAERGLDASDVARAIHATIDAGLDLIDVAADDDSERLVAEAIRTLYARDRVITATRVPAIAERAGRPTRDVLPERLPARYIQDRIEASLRATRFDALPLAQVNVRAAWRSSSAWPELRGTCARLIREGKVLQWGALVDTIEDDTVELAQEDWLTSIAVPFNLCERAAEPVLAAATEKKIAVLARRPLAGGALAGTLGPGVRLKPRDDRHAFDDKQLERFAVGAAKLSAFVKREPPAARSCEPAKAQLDRNKRPDQIECMTVAELALRFVMERGAIALPRLHRHEHVIEALLAAGSPPLPGNLLDQLDI